MRIKGYSAKKEGQKQRDSIKYAEVIDFHPKTVQKNHNHLAGDPGILATVHVAESQSLSHCSLLENCSVKLNLTQRDCLEKME